MNNNKPTNKPTILIQYVEWEKRYWTRLIVDFNVA